MVMDLFSFCQDNNRPICKVAGCNNPRESKGWEKRHGTPKRKYRPFCSHHQYLHTQGLPLDKKPAKHKLSISFMQDECIVRGCDRPQRNKGNHKGKRVYGTLCQSHYNLKKRGIPVNYIDINKCYYCGEQIPCDIHRIIPGKDGGKYEIGNVISACPNCHRRLTLGLPLPMMQTRENRFIIKRAIS